MSSNPTSVTKPELQSPSDESSKKDVGEGTPSKHPLHKMRDAYKGLFSNSEDSGYKHLASASGDTFKNMLTFNYLNVTSEILKVIEKEFSALVPSGDDVADAQRLQNSILLKLEQLGNNPVFQEKMKELTKSIAKLINTMINSILDLVEEEGEETIEKIGRVSRKMLTNLAATGVDTAEDALSVIPGVDAVVALFILFTSVITDGANSMLTGLTLFNAAIQLSEKLAKRVLGVDSEVLNLITEIQDMINAITSPGMEANKLADKSASALDKFNRIPEGKQKLEGGSKKRRTRSRRSKHKQSNKRTRSHRK